MTSGNGVKVTQQQQAAKFIRVGKIWTHQVNKIKKGDYVAIIGATSATLAEIKQAVSDEITRQDIIRASRRALWASCSWHANRIVNLLYGKRNNITKWADLRERSLPLGKALDGSYVVKDGSYVVIGDFIAKVTCDEDVEWGVYAKSYKYPKVTITNRRVELLALSHFGQYIKVVTVVYLDSFRGNFLVNAVAKLLNLAPVAVPKHLKPVQLNPYFGVEPIRNINGVIIYIRTFGGYAVDYCAMTKGVTYHASTEKSAIDGLRKKLQAKVAFDSEAISYETGRKMGFCHLGISQFAEDNDLDIDGEYTRAELRNTVIKKRQLNVNKYRQELAKLGILISMVC